MIPEFKFCLDKNLIQHCNDNGIDPHSFLPTKSDPLSAGWDVKCADPNGVDLIPFHYLKIPLGFRIYIPSGWFLKLVPRSSTFIKRHIVSLYGTIDESYEGFCYYCCHYVPDSDDIVAANTFKKIEFGDRIAQLIPMKRYDIQCLSINEQEFSDLCCSRAAKRGAGGFGSTGK